MSFWALRTSAGTSYTLVPEVIILLCKTSVRGNTARKQYVTKYCAYEFTRNKQATLYLLPKEMRKTTRRQRELSAITWAFYASTACPVQCYKNYLIYTDFLILTERFPIPKVNNYAVKRLFFPVVWCLFTSKPAEHLSLVRIFSK